MLSNCPAVVHFVHLSLAFPFPSFVFGLLWYCFSGFSSVSFTALFVSDLIPPPPFISGIFVFSFAFLLLITLGQDFIFQMEYLYYNSLLIYNYSPPLVFLNLCSTLLVACYWIWNMTMSFYFRFCTAYYTVETFILFYPVFSDRFPVKSQSSCMLTCTWDPNSPSDL